MGAVYFRTVHICEHGATRPVHLVTSFLLKQNLHHLSQNGTAQLIKGILNHSPRDDFEVQISKLRAELNGVRHIT